MKLKCLACKKTISKPYAADRVNGDLFGCPWYIDDTGLKHLALVCLHCGTIHDASGSVLRALLTGFKSPMKIHNDINPMELSMMIMSRSDGNEIAFRNVAIDDIGIPERVIDVLVERKILGHAFQRKEG
jgi:hypothetical protein